MKRLHNTVTVFISLFLITSAVHGKQPPNDGQQHCGNNCGKGITNCKCKVCAGDPFDPYTGNEYRKIKDLEVWGGVGEIQLVWMRYAYSRYGLFLHEYGHSHNWNSSFNYNMSDAGVNAQGQALIYVHYAEGGSTYFAQDKYNPRLWQPVPEVDKRLFQDGNNFYLQTGNGYRYRFEKLSGSNGYFYQLQDIRDSKQNLYRLTYDSKHLLSRVTEPAGRYLEITHDTLFGIWRVITQVSTSDGRSVHYRYELFNDGLISSLSLVGADYGDGTKAQYTYSQSEPGSKPNLEHAIDPRYDGTDVNMRFTYDNDNAWGFIKEERNGISGKVMVTLTPDAGKSTVCYANGRVQIYNMPDEMLGKIKSYIDGLGRKTEYDYHDNTGFLTMNKDALGRITTYDSLTVYGSPVVITHPDGSKEKYKRDDLDQVLMYTDELGRITTYKRDAKHRITRIDYPDSSNERFIYNHFGQILTHIRRNGGVETNAYNNRGLKTRFIDAEGNVTQYMYNSADLLTSIIDARHNTVGYVYNERGLAESLINADKSLQTYTYDDFGNRTSVTNEIGNTWIRLYDEFKRPDSLIDPLGRLTVYQYDLPGGVCGCSHDNGKPTSITSPGGKITKIEYDVEWQKVKQTSGFGTPDAATTFYEYDLVDNLVAIIDPRGKQWLFAYDLRNRPANSTDPLGHKKQKTYDQAGNLIMVQRADGSSAFYQYDNMNRKVKSTDAKGQILTMNYDAEDNITRLTDPNNHIYNFDYDLMNRRTEMVYPGGRFERYTYDEVGNVTTYANRAGDVRTFTYDNLNRETRSVWSDNTPAITRSYDAAGRLLTLLSDVSLLTYSYDAANELTAETQDVNGAKGGARTVSYGYNADGLINTLSYHDGSTVLSYLYTGRNQIKTISANGAPDLVSYTYDLNGNRAGKALKNGTGTAYMYDDDNRTLRVDNQKAGISFSLFEYGYDAVNRRTFVRRDNGKGDVYTYDAIDQVTGVQYEVTDPEGAGSNPESTVNYNWDASGNRMNVNNNGIITNYNTNNRNEYTKVGDNILTNNTNGDIKTFNGWTYTYDAQDRLTRARKGDSSIHYLYDARNRCVRRDINGTITYHYYDRWNLIEEINDKGTSHTEYIHGAQVDEMLIKASDGDTVFYHNDALGNVTQLTDVNGKVTESYRYDIFGNSNIKNAIGQSLTESAYGNRFMFTGREYMKVIDLYDYRNRMYSPYLGRFLQPDPIGFNNNDINTYRYAKNNVVNRIDPYGLITWDDFQGTVPDDSPWDAETAISLESDYKNKSSCDKEKHEATTWTTSASVKAVMDKSQSWSRSGSQTDALLRHESGHIKLTETVAAEAETAILQVKVTIQDSNCDCEGLVTRTEAEWKKQVDEILAKAEAKKNELNDQYDRETNHGTSGDAQNNWQNSHGF